MATLPDFHYALRMFKLKHLGIWGTFPKGENTGQFTQKKFVVHYKTDRTDINKNEEITNYVNRSSSSVDKNFSSTPISVVPIFKPFLEDKMKLKITKHSMKQMLIGSNI